MSDLNEASFACYCARTGCSSDSSGGSDTADSSSAAAASAAAAAEQQLRQDTALRQQHKVATAEHVASALRQIESSSVYNC
jgi:hypothetical protein